MAKGQTRSNREVKKPKANKPAAAAPLATVKNALAPIVIPKKKG
jgi:hypothetical protein